MCNIKYKENVRIEVKKKIKFKIFYQWDTALGRAQKNLSGLRYISAGTLWYAGTNNFWDNL